MFVILSMYLATLWLFSFNFVITCSFSNYNLCPKRNSRDWNKIWLNAPKWPKAVNMVSIDDISCLQWRLSYHSRPLIVDRDSVARLFSFLCLFLWFGWVFFVPCGFKAAMSLDCPFMIAPSFLSNVDLLKLMIWVVFQISTNCQFLYLLIEILWWPPLHDT
jgi:hypothetical protein